MPSSRFVAVVSVLALLTAYSGCETAGRGASWIPADYRGKPFGDARHPAGPQVIPGRVECAYYDLGGEGIAYHDTDPINHGSGELNTRRGTSGRMPRPRFGAFAPTRAWIFPT